MFLSRATNTHESVRARVSKKSEEGLSFERVDSLDSARDPGLPALLDRHTLEIHSGDVRQLWLLEKSGSGYAARLMMHNP